MQSIVQKEKDAEFRRLALDCALRMGSSITAEKLVGDAAVIERYLSGGKVPKEKKAKR